MQQTIAIVFDFDDTLAPDSTSSYLEAQGVDVRRFWQERVNALRDDGWDPVPAYLYMMLRESERRAAGSRFTRDSFAEWGAQIKLYSGATRIFSELKAHLESIHPAARLEFYLISSGIGDILRHTRIARYFTDIWACEFVYTRRGEIEFPKRMVSFTDKTRYLFHVSKGLVGAEYANKPFEVNRKVPAEQLRVPFSQMIFVGDGMTDVPCFSLVKRQGGHALGIYDPDNQDKWGRAWGFVEADRLSNLAPANYGKNSHTTNSLKMAISAIALGMRSRETTYQG